MVGHGGSSAGSYLADPTSPSPPTVHQLSRLALQELTCISLDMSTRSTSILDSSNVLWSHGNGGVLNSGAFVYKFLKTTFVS